MEGAVKVMVGCNHGGEHSHSREQSWKEQSKLW